MSNVLTLDGITGSDGVKPVYEPNARWTTWNIHEIYTGQQGTNRYVPKIDDYVIDPDTNVMRKVVALDQTTMVPTLDLIVTVDTGEFSDYDKLIGVTPGMGAYTFRAYLDQTVMPHTLAVDARVLIPGTTAIKAVIYRGSELLGTQKIISAFYDQSGTLLGQEIPLELASINQVDNKTIKSVPPCHTVENIPDGEVLTLVAFSALGHVVYKRQLLTENTGYIRSTALGIKYITSISLESPFMSKSDPKLVQYPINVPMAGLNLIGVVTYSDGTQLRMPVDGTKFQMFGWEGYTATIVGQKFGVVLKYNLSNGEVVYGQTVTDGRFITDTFKATTTNADGAYTVKLFGYPVWIDATNGYRMEWFLYNLDRNIVYRVTPYVKASGAGQVFNPTAYGFHQQIGIAINLNDVNGTYASYKHTQLVDVVLVGPGTQRTTNWMIGYDPNQNPLFGENNFAATTFINQNLMSVKVDCGATTKDEWLDRLYLRTKPLVDPDRELAPPQPDFFSLVIGSQDVEFPISQWSSDLLVNQVLGDSSTLFVKFFKRTADGDMHLAVAGLPVYQQN